MDGLQETEQADARRAFSAQSAMTLDVITLLAVIFSVAIREARAGQVTTQRSTEGVESLQQRPDAPVAVLHVATDASYWPMEYISGTQIIGYDIDHMNAIGSRLGVNVVYTNVPWKDIFDGLVGGQYDAVISAVSVTPEREDFIDFSLPYVTFGTSEDIAIVQQGNDALRRQLNEGLRSVCAAGILDAIIAGISADVTQWQPHLPAWPASICPL